MSFLILLHQAQLFKIILGFHVLQSIQELDITSVDGLCVLSFFQLEACSHHGVFWGDGDSLTSLSQVFQLLATGLNGGEFLA